MLDLEVFLMTIFQCFVVSIIVVAVRMFFPPGKITVVRVVKAVVTSVFVAVLISYHAQENAWSQNEQVISIMIGALVAENIINRLMQMNFLKNLGRVGK